MNRSSTTPPRATARRRRHLGLLLALIALLLTGGTVATPQPAAAAPVIDPNANYALVNRHSGMALDLYNFATNDGADIVQWTRNDGAWQQWQFVDAGGGYYEIRSAHSGKVLDVQDASTADGAGIVQWSDLNRTSQQWRIADSGDDYIRLINRNSGKALDLLDFSTANGGQLIQWPDLNGPNQQWELIKVGASSGTFSNPIKTNGPDPWLQYHDGYYYLATTTWNSTITMRRSTTLAGLRNASDQTIFNLSGMPNGCCNMWAPEFHLLDGPNGPRWYLYYVAGQNVSDYNPTQRLHVLESDGTNPMGPYHFKADLNSNAWELDPSILRVDGDLYLMGSGIDGTQSLTITAMSNPWTTSGSRRTISSPTYSWETQSGSVNEGAEALYHDGEVMIVYSASACWGPDYKLGLLTLTGNDPLSRSSWTKHSTPVFQRNDAAGVYAPGHNGFFTSPDGTEDWIVYHANSSASGGCDMNRSTRAQQFTWNADGTPNFGTPVPTGVALTSPSGE